MTLFVDTASFEEASKWIKQYGVAKGITTNQKIFSMEKGIDYKERIKELVDLHVPVSIELTQCNETAEGLFKEGYNYMNDFGQNIAVKVPMWSDGKGLEVARRLLQKGVKINMTCLMNVEQVVLTCGVGATYASLFYNRTIDYKKTQGLEEDKAVKDTLKELAMCRDIIDKQGYKTKIICGSIRKPEDVSNCLANGAHIVTVTPKVLDQLPFHPKTEETIREFDKAWREWTK
jgi:TalC/MipB family fructose-6-phosphate aldolase